MTETLEPPTRTAPMAEVGGSKPVRINGESANKLQAVEAMKKLMGERFKPVEFLNGLVVDPIDALYDDTVRAFSAHNAATAKQKRKDAK